MHADAVLRQHACPCYLEAASTAAKKRLPVELYLGVVVLMP